VAVGALDYLMLCEHLKVLFIEDIPVLSSLEADSAKRFVTLIDTLYESHTKLICIADEPPEKLYTTGAGSFEFNRTVSRLYEMQSERWIKAIRI
jgi:cell division protein ZapE